DAADLGDWRLVAESQIARPGRTRDPLAGMGMGMGGRRPRRGTDGLPHVASELIAVKITESPVKGKFALAGGEQGKTAKVVCKLEAGAIPAGSFTAKLDGLPPRVKSEPVAVKADAKEIEFTVAIDQTTPVGSHASLVCELTGTVGGQKVVYRVGRGGTLRVD